MRRFILDLLETWVGSPERKPLLLRGARQVGKTFVLRELGRTAFSGKTHLVDFEQRPDVAPLFERDLRPARIIAELEVALGSHIAPGRDLLILDEIQACPRALVALKYFAEQLPELHVAAAGSLLEFALADRRYSFPVGQVQPAHLFPMSLPEFLAAMGNDAALDVVADPRELSTVAHEALMEQVRLYCRIGGMPAAVAAYTANGASLLAAERVQAAILTTYRADFAKYRPRVDPRCLDTVLGSVARTVGRQTVYARLAPDFTGPTIKAAFDALENAGVVRRIRAVPTTRLPLAAAASPRRFKPLFLDVGLLQQAAGLTADVGLERGGVLDSFAGAVTEQFVGQQLLAHSDPRLTPELYYWSRAAPSSQAEVDYLVVGGGRAHAVEVRNARVGGVQSMRVLLSEHPGLAPGYVLSAESYAVDERRGVVRLPLYYAGALPQILGGT